MQVTPSMALYDTMDSLKSPMGTLALGYAYNTAGFLLAAGTKVYKRGKHLTMHDFKLVTQNAPKLFLHDPLVNP